MSDIDALPPPSPSVDQERLERLESRVAELEAKLSAAQADADSAQIFKAGFSLTSSDLAVWLRNNPVLALIIAIVALVILAHLLD